MFSLKEIHTVTIADFFSLCHVRLPGGKIGQLLEHFLAPLRQPQDNCAQQLIAN